MMVKSKRSNMKRLFCIFCVSALFAPGAVLATDATWVNNGTLLEPPNIDALTVINNGSMGTPLVPFFTTALFDTSNTQNLTNSGSMYGSLGFRFDNAPRNSSGQLIGLRKPAANFHNRVSGSINAIVSPIILSPSGFRNGQLLIQATNVINQGLLTVGADGLIQVVGTNVNLSRGGFGVLSIDESAPVGSFNDVPAEGLFLPDFGITDNYWAQTDMVFRVNTLIGPDGVIRTPVHGVQVPRPGGGYGSANTALQLFDYQYDALSNVLADSILTLSVTNMDGSETNITIYTNEVRQAAFVQLAPGDFSTAVSIEFVPTSLPTNDYFSALITLYMPTTNVLTGELTYNVAYLQDTLAGELDRGNLTNYFTTLGGLDITRTFRPKAYIVSRIQQELGVGGNTPIDTTFFYPTNSTTNIVSGAYAAYSAHFDNILQRPPNIPPGTATNLTGRAEVQSGSLDISRARLRGEGLLSLQTSHLVSSSNAVVDCENLSLDLGSTNGLLRIQDITKTTAGRVRGDIFVWSAQWSNSYQVVTANYDASTNPVVAMPITNIINVQNHILVYDASQLATVVPAVVQQFHASATNIVMDDDANIVLELQLKGESFTLNGEMNLSGGVPDWRYTNAPGLRYLTNNGTMDIANEAHFGDDGPLPYLAFVNRGTIIAQGQTVVSSYAELAGTNNSLSSIYVTAADVKVEGGRVNALGDIYFGANNLKLNQGYINSTGRVFLVVTNALYDNGPGSANTIVTRDGFYQTIKPPTGDLLGTAFRSQAPTYAQVNHLWAGRNDGVSTTGYVNNDAIGILALVPEGADPLFQFGGVDAQNGMYVDLLDLSLLSDYASQVEIDPNLVIYYAAAKLNFPPPGNLTPEEYLDGQFGGRLRWVREFAGPNSSVDVVVNGDQTIKVNKALRNSKVIDSDADGVPNYYDTTPFDGVVVQAAIQSTAPNNIAISWNAAPGVAYRVEYKTQNSPAWQLLTTTTNTSGAATTLTVTDTSSDAVRYYRVSYNPTGQ